MAINTGLWIESDTQIPACFEALLEQGRLQGLLFGRIRILTTAGKACRTCLCLRNPGSVSTTLSFASAGTQRWIVGIGPELW